MLKDWLTYDIAYTKVENEIREWVEQSYPGLSIDFEPHLEIVRTDKNINYTPKRVKRITEAVNIKIGAIMEQHDRELYYADCLRRIWEKHPEFNPDVKDLKELFNNAQFQTYFAELSLKKKEVKDNG